jgi:hypothetical protein
MRSPSRRRILRRPKELVIAGHRALSLPLLALAFYLLAKGVATPTPNESA